MQRGAYALRLELGYFQTRRLAAMRCQPVAHIAKALAARAVGAAVAAILFDVQLQTAWRWARQAHDQNV